MLIACKDLTFKYPHTDSLLFKGLTCEFSGPGLHALFGPSGVGKTTLAKALAGQIHGFSGEIITDGMGSVLYSYNMERLPGWCNVGDHLGDVTPDASEDKMDDVIRVFGLEGCLTSRFPQLSLGQQNRINLARYLLQDFDCLIMDESLANVDEPTRQDIIVNMKEMFSAKVFVYISHNVLEVSKFCDQILVLRSPYKEPQAIRVLGCDHKTARAWKERDLETAMLEVVHAT